MKQYVDGTEGIKITGLMTPGLAIKVEQSLVSGQFYSLPVRFNHSGSWQSTEILIDAIQPYYGGKRYYFICSYCRRRCLGLYFLNDELACRRCHRLKYLSQCFVNDSAEGLLLRHLKSSELARNRRITHGKQFTRAGRRFFRLYPQEDEIMSVLL